MKEVYEKIINEMLAQIEKEQDLERRVYRVDEFKNFLQAVLLCKEVSREV